MSRVSDLTQYFVIMVLKKKLKLNGEKSTNVRKYCSSNHLPTATKANSNTEVCRYSKYLFLGLVYLIQYDRYAQCKPVYLFN